MGERMKVCNKCGETKPITDFYLSAGMRDGRRNDCKACNLAAKKKRYDADPQKEIGRVKEWQRRNRSHYLAYQKIVRERPVHKRKERNAHLRGKFGITPEQCEEMLEAQGGGCAICGRASRSDISLHVDHEHDEGRVRGLLCFLCNQALSAFGDQSSRCRAAAAYLDTHDPEAMEEIALARARVQVLASRWAAQAARPAAQVMQMGRLSADPSSLASDAEQGRRG